jgi:hypothetical protein
MKSRVVGTAVLAGVLVVGTCALQVSGVLRLASVVNAIRSCVPHQGSVLIEGAVVSGDNCPQLTSWAASPLRTSVGGAVAVAAAATDADPKDLLTFRWASTAGPFADPTAARTVLTCASPGSHTINLTVSDNHGTAPCTDSVTMLVTCAR